MIFIMAIPNLIGLYRWRRMSKKTWPRIWINCNRNAPIRRKIRRQKAAHGLAGLLL